MPTSQMNTTFLLGDLAFGYIHPRHILVVHTTLFSMGDNLGLDAPTFVIPIGLDHMDENLGLDAEKNVMDNVST